MPWRESCAMDERLRFMADFLRGEMSMVELCELYEVSRKTGYKWRSRYESAGAAGLAERSHAPLCHGRATPAAMIEAVEALRRQYPSWGPLKILGKLQERDGQADWPSRSTIADILKKAGLASGRRVRRRAPPRLHTLTVPQHANHVWRVDYKGWQRLGDGSRSEPLTATDGFSRYLVGLGCTCSPQEAEAKVLFERMFAEHGLPEVIRSDNGLPFASASVTGLTRLSAWWLKLGIRHERIDPGAPQQNGGHERFHRTLLEAMTPPAADMTEQAQRFCRFAQYYNEERPHEALGQRPPARFYRPSERAMPPHLPEPVYPAEAAVRQVRSNGEIKWQGDLVFVSSALVGEALGLEEQENGQWIVRFFDTPLGIIDPKTNKLRRPAAPRPGGGGPAKPQNEPGNLSPIHSD